MSYNWTWEKNSMSCIFQKKKKKKQVSHYGTWDKIKRINTSAGTRTRVLSRSQLGSSDDNPYTTNVIKTWGTRVFARGPPPHYWLGPTVFDCADQTGCGKFTVVWPQMIISDNMRVYIGPRLSPKKKVKCFPRDPQNDNFFHQVLLSWPWIRMPGCWSWPRMRNKKK